MLWDSTIKIEKFGIMITLIQFVQPLEVKIKPVPTLLNQLLMLITALTLV